MKARQQKATIRNEGVEEDCADETVKLDAWPMCLSSLENSTLRRNTSTIIYLLVCMSGASNTSPMG